MGVECVEWSGVIPKQRMFQQNFIRAITGVLNPKNTEMMRARERAREGRGIGGYRRGKT